MISYDGSDYNTTINPDDLPDFFKTKCFDKISFPSLLDITRDNFYYISS